MKGYYLFAPVEPENAGPDSGVERKVRAQHKALNEFLDCELVILPPATYKGTKVERIIRRLPFTTAWRKWKYAGEFEDADFLYIRQVYHDYSFLRYIREIKKNNPKIKIIYEVPTFPYDQQRSWSLSSAPFLIKERLNRSKTAKYFDRIVTFYGQKTIWNVPCIPIMNGFDFSSAVLPERHLTEDIHIVTVAATAFWHGYNYLIEGLREYYSTKRAENIILHMVGNILPQHREMVNQYNLQKHVVFHGKLSGDQLAEVYKGCSIGVNVLGVCSDGNPKSSSLKSREYGAYGLPIVSALPIDYLPMQYPYLCLVPEKNEPVDVGKIVDFYHEVYDGNQCNEVAKKIRDYAEKRCDMRITMKPVIDWLLNREDKA